MISGASQADLAVLVISARKGEFETGFEKGGQTREHTLLAKSSGIKKLIVAINKMDDATVQWSKERYDECVFKLTPYLRSCGYNDKDVAFLPISGFTGINLKTRVSIDICPWYK
jgi:peptide chain release factor subunit 3